jgi:Raf kinase inhibitor-like YbhB/YbcL family protein
MTPRRILTIAWALILFLGCDEDDTTTIEVRSVAFGQGEEIPNRHTCQGEGISPPLTYSGTPEGTVSIAVIAEDADRLIGVYTHLLLWGLSPRSTVPENLDENLPEHVTVGVADDESTVGYLTPCPPPGDPHRFFFKVYALDRNIPLEKGASREELDEAMKGHVLGYGELMGQVSPK